jgi:hypothetical protein
MKKGERFDIDWKPLALLFLSHLSKKDRRLFCGLEAVRSGVHGVSEVSSFYRIHPHTVRTGKEELQSGILLPSDQVRRPGGGRKKKRYNCRSGKRVDGYPATLHSRQSHE